MTAPAHRGIRTARTGPASLRSSHAPDDAELITLVRAGDRAAFGTLYLRHRASAYHLARRLAAGSNTEQDDLVAEAFRRVLETLLAGRGPDSAFRAYLLTTLRHIAYDKTRQDRRITLIDDLSEADGVPANTVSIVFTDPAVVACDRALAVTAFAHLPQRLQVVLRHTEIEHRSPAEVAPILDLTPNGVAALAYRARNHLRQEYLQAQLAESSVRRHRAITSRLGAWVRNGLSPRAKARVDAHLQACGDCQALAVELIDINPALWTARPSVHPTDHIGTSES
jgi:RNA polymerase sigma factor (sigma-70 family)